MKPYLFFYLLSVLIAACVATGSPPTITITPSSQSPISPPPTRLPSKISPTPSQLPAQGPSSTAETNTRTQIEDIVIPAVDSLEIVGTLYSPLQSEISLPAVLLLHMLGSDRSAWEDFALRLTLEGYVALAIDMRGHGDTGGDRDFTTAAQDILRVWDYLSNLPEVDRDSTAVVGASIGSNMALVTAANQPAIDTVVLLSPGLEYRGVTTDDALMQYGDRPILIVASTEDTYAAQSSQQLEDLAQGEVQLILYTGAGHGTSMFTSKPELVDEIITWLDQHIN